MKNCVLCGGGALRDFDPRCAHTEELNPPPEPVVEKVEVRFEYVWRASLRFGASVIQATHPLKDTAIEMAKDCWRWRRRCPLGRGERFRHRVRGYVITLLFFHESGSLKGHWNVKEGMSMYSLEESKIFDEFDLMHSDLHGKWLTLARSPNYDDRKSVIFALRELGIYNTDVVQGALILALNEVSP